MPTELVSDATNIPQPKLSYTKSQTFMVDKLQVSESGKRCKTSHLNFLNKKTTSFFHQFFSKALQFSLIDSSLFFRRKLFPKLGGPGLLGT